MNKVKLIRDSFFKAIDIMEKYSKEELKTKKLTQIIKENNIKEVYVINSLKSLIDVELKWSNKDNEKIKRIIKNA